MTIQFSEILIDLRKTTTEYKLYIPKEFGNYADSQTKETIDLLKNEIKFLNEENLIPPIPFLEILNKTNFSNIENKIKNSEDRQESDFKEQIDENLQIFKEKKEKIINYLTNLYKKIYESKYN